MVRLRLMTEDDIDAVAALRVRGWRGAYAGILPAAYLAAMSPEDDAARRRARFGADPENLVAVDARGTVTGWACHGRGELLALYVEPALTGGGIGRGLLHRVHARAAGQGRTGLHLWVLAGNTGARRFYERAGYTADGAARSDTYAGVEVPEVRYGCRFGAG
jgi:GNAT superfamily N-acetyltransferase